MPYFLFAFIQSFWSIAKILWYIIVWYIIFITVIPFFLYPLYLAIYNFNVAFAIWFGSYVTRDTIVTCVSIISADIVLLIWLSIYKFFKN